MVPLVIYIYYIYIYIQTSKELDSYSAWKFLFTMASPYYRSPVPSSLTKTRCSFLR